MRFLKGVFLAAPYRDLPQRKRKCLTDVDKFDEVVSCEVKFGLVHCVDGHFETAVQRRHTADAEARSTGRRLGQR